MNSVRKYIQKRLVSFQKARDNGLLVTRRARIVLLRGNLMHEGKESYMTIA